MLPAKRVAAIIEHLTYETYLFISRGLFERHKLVFSLMLAIKVMPEPRNDCWNA